LDQKIAKEAKLPLKVGAFAADGAKEAGHLSHKPHAPHPRTPSPTDISRREFLFGRKPATPAAPAAPAAAARDG